MTCFVVSHYLQVEGPDVPSLTARELAAGLQNHSTTFKQVEVLDHPHWLIRVESDAEAKTLGEELIRTWRAYRRARGHSERHVLLALGGRKDTPTSPGSPLNIGQWGVDVVETTDAESFLTSIGWEALKQGRPSNGVFELRG